MERTPMLLNSRLITLGPKWQTVHSAWAELLPAAFWLVELLRPRLLVELGSHAGDSYCAFAQASLELGLDNEGSKLMAVDTWEGDEHSLTYGPDIHAKLAAHHDPLYGHFSQLNRTLFDNARTQVEDGAVDLLHIDGLHTYAAAKHDFASWLPAISDRGVVLFHDVTERKEGFGVWQLWDELTPNYPHLLLPHGHGLGILAVGKEVPEKLTPFLQGDQAQTIEILHALGRACEEKRLRLVAEAEAARIQADHDALAKHANALERALEGAQQTNAETAGHLDAAHRSLSWKLTAPLRKLRGKAT